MSAGLFGDLPDEALERLISRMKLNFLNISFVNGEIRRETYRVDVLPNPEDEMPKTVETFYRLRSSSSGNAGLSKKRGDAV